MDTIEVVIWSLVGASLFILIAILIAPWIVYLIQKYNDWCEKILYGKDKNK